MVCYGAVWSVPRADPACAKNELTHLIVGILLPALWTYKPTKENKEKKKKNVITIKGLI